jgi:hypothetical protein
MRYKSFQEVIAKYALSLGLDEQTPLADWEARLKGELGAKRKALSGIKNPSLKHKAERECADLEEAFRLASQQNLFGRLRHCIQEDKQETFEWELRKPESQAALPTEEESFFGDYLDLKGEARKKWPSLSFPAAKPAVAAPAPPAPIASPAPPPTVAPAPPPTVAPVLPLPPAPAAQPTVTAAVPPPPAPIAPTAPPPIASAPPAQAATGPEPVPGLPGSIGQGAKAATTPAPMPPQIVSERLAVPPVAVKPSVQPTEFGPPPAAPAPAADKTAPAAAPDKTAPPTDKAVKKGEQPQRGLNPIGQFFALIKALATGKALPYLLGALLLAVIAALIAIHKRPSPLAPTPPAPVAQTARLAVESQPRGVRVTLNGESKLTPAEFTLKPGSHKVEAALEGYWPTNADITLKGGQRFALSFVDRELPGASLPPTEAGGNSAVVPLSIKYARLDVVSLSGSATASVKGQSKPTPANFRLRPDSYEVRIALEGFRETNIPVRLMPGQNFTLTLQDASKPSANMTSSDPNQLRVPLQARSVPPVIKEVPPVIKEVPLVVKEARLVVKTVPSAARVILNAGNERREQAAPATFEPLRPGSYEVEASTPGYFAKTNTVRLAAGEDRTLTLELEELRAKVAVKTEPAGAQVYLDGVLQLEHTPATQLLASLGNHEVGVELEGYRRQTRQIRASSADPLLVDFGRLVPKSATLTIRSTPSYATITLRGKGRPITSTTPQSFEVKPPGQCTIEVALAGYEPVTQTVTLTDGDKKEIDIPLKARRVTLRVQTDPTGASIYVGGTWRGTTSGDLQLDPGSYDIELRKEGYRPKSRQVDLKPGAQPYSLSETLEKNPPPVVSSLLTQPILRRESAATSAEELIRNCADTAAQINEAGRGGKLFTPSGAKAEKAKWEAWKSDHQLEFDRSDELQKAWKNVIKAINMNTQGAM